MSSTHRAGAIAASDEWATPQALYDKLHDEFGFNLDAAASAATAKCAEFWTVEDDALTKPWKTSTFVNPPYGRTCADCPDKIWKGKKWPEGQRCTDRGHTSRTLDHWFAKAVWEQGLGSAVVMLTYARTDVAWWHDCVMHYASEVRLVRGRLKFEINGQARHPAPAPSAVIVFPAHRDPGVPVFSTLIPPTS